MLLVRGEEPCTERHEPRSLGLQVGATQVQVDTVLHGLRLGNELEEETRGGARSCFDEDGRIILGPFDPRAAQPFELVIVVRSDVVALARLLADEDASQYGTTYLTRDRARAMVRRARTVLEGMGVLLREGASSQPSS